MVETLEVRTLLSGVVPSDDVFQSDSAATGGSQSATPFLKVAGPPSALPTGATPAQIRHAYGFDTVVFGATPGDGTGQTIAIVTAYDTPTALSDLKKFDTQFNIPDPPTFTKMSQIGSKIALPPTDPAGPGNPLGNWERETLLDIQWAHAIAPGADILLVEADDNTPANLYQAAAFAASQPGVSVVSMSFGFGETLLDTSTNSIFTTPSGHAGVTFVAATGDTGSPGSYPAYSPTVLAVGGTTLTLDPLGNITSETGWSGSGGGISLFQTQPSYQTGTVSQTNTRRATPDVSFEADEATGVPYYDSYNNSAAAPWTKVGGTSFSAPAWAGLIAIANQGRTLAGKAVLDGVTDTLPTLYQLPSADFRDILTGSNGFNAVVGYDLVTGRGSPRASLVINGLIGPSAFGNPFIDLNGTATGADFTTSFNVNGVPVLTQAPTATVSDPGIPTLSSLTVTITNVKDGAAEKLTADVTGTSITKSYTNGRLRLTGTDTVANYQKVLLTVAYQNTALAPDMTDRTITFLGSDGTQSTNVPTSIVKFATPTVQFSAAAQTVDETANSFAVTVTLSGTLTRDVTIPVTLSGTAVAGVDYTLGTTPSPITITVTAGSTSATVNGTVINHMYAGQDIGLTLILTMGTPTSAIPGVIAAQTVTILHRATFSNAFVVGLDNQVYAQKFDSFGNSISNWIATAPGEVKSVSVGRDANNNPTVYVIGLDDQVYVQRTANSVTSYSLTGAALVKSLGVRSDASDNQEIFVVGLDDQVYAMELDKNGNVTAPFFLTAAGEVKAMSVGHDALRNPMLFVIGMDDQLYAQRLTSDGSPTNGYFFASAGVYKALSNGNTTMGNPEVLAIGSDNQVYAQKFDASGVPVGVAFLTRPGQVLAIDVGKDTRGNLLLLAIQPDSQLYSQHFDPNGDSSTDYKLVQSGGVQAFSIIRDAGINRQILAIGLDGQLYSVIYDDTLNAYGNFSLTRTGAIKSVAFGY